MRRLSLYIVLLLSALIGLRAVVVPQTPVRPADLVLTNGTVITVDARDTIAEAVAVTDGRIAFAGKSSDAKKYIGERTQVIDLRGRTATPGLIDAHCHFSEAADQLNLGDPAIKTIADVIAKVKAWADKLPAGQWVRFVVKAGMGPQSTGTWDLSVTAPGQPAKVFEKLPNGSPDWKSLQWLGFSSTANAATVFYLDNVELSTTAKTDE